MPFLDKIKIDEGELFLWEITEPIETLLKLGQDFTREVKFIGIKNEKRQKEWLAVRLLLQQAGCSNEQISYTENGKPCIRNSAFQSISISHSNKLAGVFLHPKEHCGLDIESADRDFGRVEKKYLSEEESALASRTEDGLGWFWCIKEAVYKAAGIDGIVFNKQIQIQQTDTDEFVSNLQVESPVQFKIFRQKLTDQLLVCCVPTGKTSIS